MGREPSAETRAGRRHRWAVGLVIVVVALVRWDALDDAPLWHDELWLRDIVARSTFTEVAAAALVRDDLPVPAPLTLGALHLSTRVFGSDARELRLLPYLAGLLSLLLTARLARRCFGRRVALTALLLMAASPLYAYYSQEAKQYGLDMAWALLLLTAFEEQLRDDAGRGRRALFAVVALAAVLSSYSMAFVLPGLALVSWRRRDRRARRWGLAVCGLCGGVQPVRGAVVHELQHARRAVVERAAQDVGDGVGPRLGVGHEARRQAPGPRGRVHRVAPEGGAQGAARRAGAHAQLPHPLDDPEGQVAHRELGGLARPGQAQRFGGTGPGVQRLAVGPDARPRLGPEAHLAGVGRAAHGQHAHPRDPRGQQLGRQRHVGVGPGAHHLVAGLQPGQGHQGEVAVGGRQALVASGPPGVQGRQLVGVEGARRRQVGRRRRRQNGTASRACLALACRAAGRAQHQHRPQGRNPRSRAGDHVSCLLGRRPFTAPIRG